MSEENQEHDSSAEVKVKDKDQETKIRLEMSPSYKELVAANQDLSAKLSMVAQKEFAAKCKKFNLDPSLATVDDLKEAENHVAPEGGETVPYGQNYYEPLKQAKEQGYNSIEEMSADLALKKKSKDPEAIAVQSLIDAKIQSQLKGKPLDVEFEGLVTKTPKPLRASGETNDQYAERIKKWLENQGKWKVKNQ
jgi:hypothetical protein